MLAYANHISSGKKPYKHCLLTVFTVVIDLQVFSDL